MSVNTNPKVTVCIPVYNGADYIKESIDSILSQSFKEFRLIICDNCSSDKTEDIVRSFRDSRISFIRNQKNLGLVGNANRCLELADGQYVYILHHDDLMLPDNLERKVRVLDENPNVGFVHSNIMLINPEGKIIASDIWEEDSRQDYIKRGSELFQQYIMKMPLGASIFIGSVLARKACYEKVGLFDPRLAHCNDSEMWMRFMQFFDVACIGSPLVKYRIHQMSTSNKWGDWTSLPYFREHYLACKIILDNNLGGISDQRRLLRAVPAAFAEQALKLANLKMEKGDYSEGKIFFWEAVRKNPLIVKQTKTAITAAKLLIGRRGISLYRKSRSIIFSSR